ASGTHCAYAAREQLRTVGKVLRDFRFRIEAKHERLVIPGADGLVQKLNCRFLLELETVADGVTGIDQKSDAQRQFGLAPETANFFNRLLIVDDLEVAFAEVLHIMVVLIRHSKHHAYFVYRANNRRPLLAARLRFG